MLIVTDGHIGLLYATSRHDEGAFDWQHRVTLAKHRQVERTAESEGEERIEDSSFHYGDCIKLENESFFIKIFI